MEIFHYKIDKIDIFISVMEEEILLTWDGETKKYSHHKELKYLINGYNIVFLCFATQMQNAYSRPLIITNKFQEAIKISKMISVLLEKELMISKEIIFELMKITNEIVELWKIYLNQCIKEGLEDNLLEAKNYFINFLVLFHNIYFFYFNYV